MAILIVNNNIWGIGRCSRIVNDNAEYVYCNLDITVYITLILLCIILKKADGNDDFRLRF